MVFSPICGEMAMDILWGNVNGHFVGKWQWTFVGKCQWTCGEMLIDMLWGNNGHIKGNYQRVFSPICGEMAIHIFW